MLQIHDERRVIGGTIRAIQWLALPNTTADDLQHRLRPDAPERLALAYLGEAGRLTFGLIRPRPRGEALDYRGPLGLAVLRFRVAERHLGANGVRLRLRVVGGLLAERGSERATLTVALEPADGRLVARLALEEYRPSVAGLPIVGRIHDFVQARVHSLHARRFLGRLAREWRALVLDER
jgi:hypothetical protein